MNAVEEIKAVDAATFEREVRPCYRPVVIRGLADGWPLVEAGRRDPFAALDLIEGFDTGRPTDIMLAPKSQKGRFFYSDDMQGFNFRREKLSLTGLSQHLRRIADSEEPIGIYAGATATQTFLPGFDAANRLPLTDGMGATPRIWLGNASQVATHFDLSDNIAVVAVGTRRFTLFPPQATEHLYIGPLERTLAGQPVSMVDPLAPDLDTYPRYAEAEKMALQAELAPGDAIYIPTLWWHHVAASAPVNVLVNYWHNDAQHGGGFLALVHAMLAIRDLPPAQKEAWRGWFDHFVFGEGAAEASAHLPPHARGVTGPASSQRDEKIRRYVQKVLAGE